MHMLECDVSWVAFNFDAFVSLVISSGELRASENLTVTSNVLQCCDLQLDVFVQQLCRIEAPHVLFGDDTLNDHWAFGIHVSHHAFTARCVPSDFCCLVYSWCIDLGNCRCGPRYWLSCVHVEGLLDCFEERLIDRDLLGVLIQRGQELF